MQIRLPNGRVVQRPAANMVAEDLLPVRRDPMALIRELAEQLRAEQVK